MSTNAQIVANQANSQHSTGPSTDSGKATSSLNRLLHGLSGSAFKVLEGEDQNAFDDLFAKLIAEHEPKPGTEEILVEQMAQSAWLKERALRLQESCFEGGTVPEHRERSLALYIRYQTTHHRAFHAALNGLLKLRAASKKQEIGFESQKQKEAQEGRRQAAEKRKADLHEFNLMLAQAKIDHETIKRLSIGMEMDVARYKEELRSGTAKAA